VRVHAAASAGSIGQGSVRARHCIKPASASIAAASAKIVSLCSDNQTICGNTAITLDNAAPAPSVTSIAGNAQHSNVPLLVHNDSSAVRRPCAIPSKRYCRPRVAARISRTDSGTVSILGTS